jgi:penicillin amidase
MNNGVRSDVSKDAKSYLNKWNFILNKSSVPAGIYAMWERKLYSEANKRFVPEELKGLVSIQLSKWLQSPGARFGTDAIKGRNDFLEETLVQAIQELTAELGKDPGKWIYGQDNYKHTSLTHPLSQALPGNLKDKYNLGPLPRGGNSHTPNSTGSADRQTSGASFRFITDLADWDKALMINTPGQSADPRSKYYSNLFELWASDKYFPAYFSKDKIKDVTEVQTLLAPGK